MISYMRLLQQYHFSGWLLYVQIFSNTCIRKLTNLSENSRNKFKNVILFSLNFIPIISASI